MLEDKYFPGFKQQFIETEPGVKINTWGYGGTFIAWSSGNAFNLAVLGATLG